MTSSNGKLFRATGHFMRYWPFVGGIHRSPVNSPHKGQWRGAWMFSLTCVWIHGWVNSHAAGDLRRYRAHYDVIVMTWTNICLIKNWSPRNKCYWNLNLKHFFPEFKCKCLLLRLFGSDPDGLICLNFEWILEWIKRTTPLNLMMTSWNGNIFRVTGHLCGEFTGLRWIPRTKASDAELWCFFDVRLIKRLSKHSRGWWFETLSHPLWRHRNVYIAADSKGVYSQNSWSK